MSRYLLLAAGLALVAGAAAAAPKTPLAIVNDVYRHVGASKEHVEPDWASDGTIFSPRLRALVAAARKAAEGDEPCGLDFDLWVAGQDSDVKSARVTLASTPDPKTQVVEAKFVNLGEANDLRFTFRLIGGRWLLDEVTSLGKTSWIWSHSLQCKD